MCCCEGRRASPAQGSLGTRDFTFSRERHLLGSRFSMQFSIARDQQIMMTYDDLKERSNKPKNKAKTSLLRSFSTHAMNCTRLKFPGPTTFGAAPIQWICNPWGWGQSSRRTSQSSIKVYSYALLAAFHYCSTNLSMVETFWSFLMRQQRKQTKMFCAGSYISYL